VLGDQLDLDAAAFDGFDAGLDAVWMAEVAEESTHVWSSKPRTVMFLAAMRHFALALQARPGRCTTRGWTLQATAAVWSTVAVPISSACNRPPGDDAPGDWRVLQAIKAVAQANGLPLEIREDRHFFCSVASSRRMPRVANRCAWSISTARCASATVC
jgi:deoxyribodipyrimidine photolyase-related protein